MAYVYKQFTAQDKAIIPFIAHKQYNYNSSSAASNRVTAFTSSYTSESVSLYSSASSYYGGDIINTIKYNQIDHLFYRDFRFKIANKRDFIHYTKQYRDLYKKANILSIPSGLYGHEIRKNTFYLSSSTWEVTDDSYGNLIISGTNLDNYPNNIVENVFRLDPIKGFKNYDLSVHKGYVLVDAVARFGFDNSGNSIKNPSLSQISIFGPAKHQVLYKDYYRQGGNDPDAPSTYISQNKQMKRTLTSEGISSSFYEDFPVGNANFPRYVPQDHDDSIFTNPLYYNNVNFKESTLGSSTSKFSTIDFDSANSSFIKIPHNNKFNFNTNEDFAISFWVEPDLTGNLDTEKRYIIAKSGTKTEVDTSASLLQDVPADSHFPYEIYMQSQSLYFARSDGKLTNTVSGEITSSGGTAETLSHVLCQYSASKMQIWFNGTLINTTTSNLEKATRNSANLYIGSRGPLSTYTDSDSNIDKYFNGDLGNINIWSRPFTATQIANISESISGTPYIGNLFYANGFATITHPKYTSDILSGSNSIVALQFQGSHLIYEHEYQCTVGEHEFNYSTNVSLRKNTETNPYMLEDFTSASFFSPYITTIGLYNESYELLAIAKLGQPVRCSDETDTTFVVRYDT